MKSLSLALSKKKLMSARCIRAPLPLYTGKPAPAILTPNSKSIISYFFAKSQCGVASAGKVGILPPERSTTLSSAPFPSGTDSWGRLGIFTKISCNLFSEYAKSDSYCFATSLSFATSWRDFSASSFLPSLKYPPITFEIEFTSERVLSSCVWAFLLFSSRLNTSFIMFSASKFLFRSRAITSLGLSLIVFNVSIGNIIYNFFETQR